MWHIERKIKVLLFEQTSPFDASETLYTWLILLSADDVKLDLQIDHNVCKKLQLYSESYASGH